MSSKDLRILCQMLGALIVLLLLANVIVGSYLYFEPDPVTIDQQREIPAPNSQGE